MISIFHDDFKLIFEMFLSKPFKMYSSPKIIQNILFKRGFVEKEIKRIIYE
jgi:hypothetical protein